MKEWDWYKNMGSCDRTKTGLPIFFAYINWFSYKMQLVPGILLYNFCSCCDMCNDFTLKNCG